MLLHIASEARGGSTLKDQLIRVIRLHGKIRGRTAGTYIFFGQYQGQTSARLDGSVTGILRESCCPGSIESSRTSPRVHIPEENEAFQCSNSI